MNNNPLETEPDIIEIQSVVHKYGAKTSLNNICLSLPKGKVLGLVGENGAGKTTLIKLILGLLKPHSGTVRVFGLDPTLDPVGVLSQIGYLAEEDGLPNWMSVAELQRYTRAFYPKWDNDYAESLRKDFGLERTAKLKNLSKGQRARTGLMLALAYRPELLLLDEPSSGLDPIVRRDILSAIIRTIANEGRTVLFSSHLLAEVERVADQVAMIQKGNIVFCDTLEAVKEHHMRITLLFTEERISPPEIDGAFVWEGSGREWTALYAGSMASLEAQVSLLNAALVEQNWLSLDEIFLARSQANTFAMKGD